MKIAIVGTGIAGNGAALALKKAGHEIIVYERENRPGGHSATVDITVGYKSLAVDTGFIVYNELNYPLLTKLFEFLDVTTQESDMSFSVSADRGAFEWCGRDGVNVVSGLFAQKRNLISPSYLTMLTQVLLFQTRAKADLKAGLREDLSLGDYLSRLPYGKRLRDDYLVPMGAAIWSTSPAKMLEFPAASFLSFFDNHRLLEWQRPRWRTVRGGSRVYVEAITAHYRDSLRLGTPVTRLIRKDDGVYVCDARGHEDRFDHVVQASHAPQSLAMLEDPSEQERAILGACTTADNQVFLHCDTSLMPRRKAAWAAWNFLREGDSTDKKACVTYWMNMLQRLDTQTPILVSLNPPFEPDPALTFGQFTYAHPQYDAGALKSQKLLSEIQGKDRIWYCGAWTGHGFHEDGLRSGLNVAQALGGNLGFLDQSAQASSPMISRAAE
jgi:predicted NAD/FAD-binding protein